MTSTIETFLKRINDAFAKGDTAYVIDNVTADIRWTMIGEPVIEGKDAFIEAMGQSDGEPPQSLALDSLIIQGTKAVLEGTMTMGNGSGAVKSYGYCDVYELTDADDPKIRVMRSYVIETNGQTGT